MLRSALEALTRRWVPGAGPVDIQPLASGLVNESYRVAREGRLFSLRVAAENSRDLGLDREWESRVLAGAAAAGLAPVIEYCDPAQGILICDWVSGRAWTAEEIRLPGTIDAIAQLLLRVHSLPVPRAARVMNPSAWIAHYADALDRRGVNVPSRLLELQGAARLRLTQLAAVRTEPVLCHGDLHRFNAIGNGDRIVLLDWEYAHVSDPFWDLAGWIANNDWTEELAFHLLAGYLRRPSQPGEWARLQCLIWLYDYVCLMWSKLYLNQRAGRVNPDVVTRAERLALRLKRASRSRAG